MKNELTVLGKQTVIYGISATAVQAVGIVTLPIFARVFSPTEYGELELASIGLMAMATLADLGLASASQRSYFDYSAEQERERKAVLSTAIAVAVGVAFLIATVIAVARNPISTWLFHTASESKLVLLTALCVPLQIAAGLLREAMRLNFRAVHYGVSCAITAFVTGGVGIAAVVGFKQGVCGVILGNIAGNLIGVLYGFCVSARHIGVHFSGGELRRMLRFGLPLVPTAGALWGLSFLDRVMLAKLGSLNDVGEYAVASRFGLLVMFAISAFALAYSPFLLSILSRDRELEKRLRGRTLTYLTIILVFLTVGMSLLSREAIMIVAPQFTTAHQLVGLICFGFVMFGISAVTMSGISIMRQSHYFAVYSLIALVINVTLNFALIPFLGSFGAGIATLAGYAALAAMYYRKSQAIYPTPYEVRKVVTVLGLGCIVIPVGLLPVGPSTTLKLIALGLFVVGLRVCRVIERSELVEARSAIRNLLRRLKPAKGAPFAKEEYGGS